MIIFLFNKNWLKFVLNSKSSNWFIWLFTKRLCAFKCVLVQGRLNDFGDGEAIVMELKKVQWRLNTSSDRKVSSLTVKEVHRVSVVEHQSAVLEGLGLDCLRGFRSFFLYSALVTRQKSVFLYTQNFLFKDRPLTSQVGIQEPSNSQYAQHWPWIHEGCHLRKGESWWCVADQTCSQNGG